MKGLGERRGVRSSGSRLTAWMAPCLALALLAFVWLIPGPLRAHELMPALLDLQESSPGRVAVTWKVPLSQGQPLPLTPVFPADCRQIGQGRQSLGPRSLAVRSTLQCTSSLRGQSVSIEGLPASATEVLLRWKPPGADWRTRVIRPAEPRITLVDEIGRAHV